MATEHFLDTAMRLAEERGWSKAELARRSGFSKSQFNKWDDGATVPATSVIAIARALDMDVVDALMQVEALLPDDVSRYAARQTLADLNLVDLAAEVYDRVLAESRTRGDHGPPEQRSAGEGEVRSANEEGSLEPSHAERVQARRRGRTVAPEPAV